MFVFIFQIICLVYVSHDLKICIRIYTSLSISRVMAAEPSKIHTIYPIYSDFMRRGFICRWNVMIESSNDIDIVFMTNKLFIRKFFPFRNILILLPASLHCTKGYTLNRILLFLFLIVSGSSSVPNGVINGNLMPGLRRELQQHGLQRSDKDGIIINFR